MRAERKGILDFLLTWDEAVVVASRAAFYSAFGRC